MHKPLISILFFFYVARRIRAKHIPDLSCCDLKFTRLAKRGLFSE